jgi:Fe-S-cluster-containing dehydrogenase component
VVSFAGGFYFVGALAPKAKATPQTDPSAYDATQYRWAFAVDTTKCLGCGSCMRACRAENSVPETYYRTWVERYESVAGGEGLAQIASNKDASFESNGSTATENLTGFLVPKLCNHCAKSVCTQVCPVGASYRSPDSVMLVDTDRCVGCGYCIQACPYGSRFKNPITHVADKCTFCYHRITKGQKTACVLACPVGARMYGNIKDSRSELLRIIRQKRYMLLKPEKGTHPHCFYIGLTQEVK